MYKTRTKQRQKKSLGGERVDQRHSRRGTVLQFTPDGQRFRLSLKIESSVEHTARIGSASQKDLHEKWTSSSAKDRRPTRRSGSEGRAEGGEGAAGPNDVEGKISKVYRREGVRTSVDGSRFTTASRTERGNGERNGEPSLPRENVCRCRLRHTLDMFVCDEIRMNSRKQINYYIKG